MTNPRLARRSLTAGLPLTLLVLLGACASASGPAPAPVQRVIAAPGKPAVTVSDLNDGAAVVVEAAQELRVELPNSAWAVQNNMAWSVTDLQPGVLTVLGARFERNTRDLNPLESEGVTSWRIRPQAPGQVRLTFGLRRPYSVGASVRSVSFDVTVR